MTALWVFVGAVAATIIFLLGYIYGRVRYWRDAETNARFVAVQEVVKLTTAQYEARQRAAAEAASRHV